MRYGFTGSSTITFPYQRTAFIEWVKAQAGGIDGFDHGDCVMADEFAHVVIRQYTDAKVTLHPPTNESKRAFCMADHEWLPKPYLARNKDVVDATDTLLAMPHGEEELRSGTWSTIRYAQKRSKPVIIFWPDGSVTSSPAEAEAA